jgi:hypothetical protein
MGTNPSTPRNNDMSEKVIVRKKTTSLDENKTTPAKLPNKTWLKKYLEPIIVLFLYIVASLIMFYPFAPVGGLSDTLNYGDSVQFTFFLSWGHEVLLSGDWGNFFALPISHPLPMAGGLTDILPGVALTTLPFRLFTSNPVLIYNLSTLLYGTLNGFFFYILCRGVGAIKPAAFVAGFFFSFNGFMQWHAIGHLSVLSFCWAPLVFLCVWNCFHRQDKYKWAALAGLFFFLQALSSSRLGIIALLGVFLLILFSGLNRWKSIGWKPGLALFFSIVISFGLVAYLYSPALVIKKHLPSKRSMIDVAMVSVDLAGYAVPNSQEARDLSLSGKAFNLTGKKLPNRNESRPYLGWSLYLSFFTLSCACLFFRFRDRKKETGFWQEHKLTLLIPWLCMGMAAALLSLGPYLWFKGEMYRIPLPWLAVIKAIPPLATFRAIARFALLVAMALCLSLALLWTYLEARIRLPKWVSYILAGFVLLGAGADFFVLSTPARFKPTLNSDLTTFLQENAHKEGAVMMFPFPGNQNWLLELIPVYPPTVNSFSGGLKNDWITFTEQSVKDIPSENSVSLMKNMGVRWIVDRDGTLKNRLKDHKDFSPVAENIYELQYPTSMELAYKMGKDMVLEVTPPITLLQDFPETNNKYLRFTFEKDTQGWVGYNMRTQTLKDGVLQFISKNTDPLIYRSFSPPLAAKKITSLQIKYRTLNSLRESINFKIYWQGDDKIIGEQNSNQLTVTTSKDWQVIQFPLTDFPCWNSNENIYQIRIDPENPSLGGTIFEINEIRMTLKD